VAIGKHVLSDPSHNTAAITPRVISTPLRSKRPPVVIETVTNDHSDSLATNSDHQVVSTSGSSDSSNTNNSSVGNGTRSRRKATEPSRGAGNAATTRQRPQPQPSLPARANQPEQQQQQQPQQQKPEQQKPEQQQSSSQPTVAMSNTYNNVEQPNNDQSVSQDDATPSTAVANSRSAAAAATTKSPIRTRARTLSPKLHEPDPISAPSIEPATASEASNSAEQQTSAHSQRGRKSVSTPTSPVRRVLRGRPTKVTNSQGSRSQPITSSSSSSSTNQVPEQPKRRGRPRRVPLSPRRGTEQPAPIVVAQTQDSPRAASSTNESGHHSAAASSYSQAPDTIDESNDREAQTEASDNDGDHDHDHDPNVKITIITTASGRTLRPRKRRLDSQDSVVTSSKEEPTAKRHRKRGRGQPRRYSTTSTSSSQSDDQVSKPMRKSKRPVHSNRDPDNSDESDLVDRFEDVTNGSNGFRILHKLVHLAELPTDNLYW
jgi:hypothetical protein